MIESGIYVRSDPRLLVESIKEILDLLGYAVTAGHPLLSEGEHPEIIGLTISPWDDSWTHIRYSKEEQIQPLLEELVNYQDIRELAYCHFKPDDHQYSYHFYRSGRMVESFSSGGPAMGAISFTSELRNIPLHEILDARQFLAQSLEVFGMTVGPRQKNGGSTVVELVAVPRKTTPVGRFLRMLKG